MGRWREVNGWTNEWMSERVDDWRRYGQTEILEPTSKTIKIPKEKGRK